MSIKRILVTGGCGFIGSNFVRFILAHRPEWSLINLDKLTYSGNRENLLDIEDDPRYRFEQGDINDRALVDRLIDECDAVVNFAAESYVDRSIADSRAFIETNVLGTHTLLDALKATAEKRLLHVSTDEVYGSLPLDRPDLKFTESTPLHGNSPYSASKAASDLLVQSYHHTFGIDALITRCANNFGAYQFPEKVIPLFVTNLMEGEKVPLYGDGLNVRDWLHVDDHCEAILAVLERGRAGEVYNIGGNNERSNLEMTHMLLEIMECDESMIQPVQDRLGHDRRYAIDARKIRDELSWEPTRSSWPAALADTVDWYKNNQSWWRKLKDRAAIH